jgi:hypothetical protein
MDKSSEPNLEANPARRDQAEGSSLATGEPESGPWPGEDDGPVFQSVPTRKLALVVLGIALAIVVLGVLGSIVTSSSGSPTTPASIRLPDGSTVALTPATKALAGLVGNGNPPSDILGNLAVPADSHVVRIAASMGQVSQYDETAFLTSPINGSQLLATYRRLLPQLGWSVLYRGSAPQNAGGTELLAKRGSSDSYYWEVGLVTSPTLSSGLTPFSLELFQLPDQN